MANQFVNKVVYGGNTLIDLTQDDVQVTDVLAGKKFHLPSGEASTGTCTYDADTTDATAVASEILESKTAYKNGAKLTGTMTNNGAVSGVISTVAGEYTIPQGYHDGSGKVSIDATEQSKIVATNIREGITILGVTGTMSAEETVNAQSKVVVPSTVQQIITPDTEDDYDYLSQVTVAPIPYTETDNAQGGKTVTIAAAS